MKEKRQARMEESLLRLVCLNTWSFGWWCYLGRSWDLWRKRFDGGSPSLKVVLEFFWLAHFLFSFCFETAHLV